MSRVEAVLEVQLGLADHVVRTDEVPVEDLHGEHRVLREGGLHLEASVAREKEMEANKYSSHQ